MKRIDCSTPKNPDAYAVVDDDDFDYLSEFKWCIDSTGYVRRSKRVGRKNICIRMHRFLCSLRAGDGMHVDHINGDRRDNRRSNLRIVSRDQNNKNVKIHVDNKSGYKGVSFHRQTGKWAAYIMSSGVHKYLGIFSTPEEAHAKYCEAASIMHGEFANNG